MYKAKYKCRLCGEEYNSLCTGSEDIASKETLYVAMGIRSEQVMAPKLYDVHYCKDGSVGMADFYGFKKENE